MKESKKILKNLVKSLSTKEESERTILIAIKKSQKDILLAKYGSAAKFDEAICELYDELNKK